MFLKIHQPGKLCQFFLGNWIAGFRGFKLMEIHVATAVFQEKGLRMKGFPSYQTSDLGPNALGLFFDFPTKNGLEKKRLL